MESAAYRRYWSRFTNAFERTGLGFGYTTFESRGIRVRIDHVLDAPAWPDSTGAWVGREVGSDHRPVVADLRLPR